MLFHNVFIGMFLIRDNSLQLSMLIPIDFGIACFLLVVCVFLTRAAGSLARGFLADVVGRALSFVGSCLVVF